MLEKLIALSISNKIFLKMIPKPMPIRYWLTFHFFIAQNIPCLNFDCMHIKEIQAKYETQPHMFCTFISLQDFFAHCPNF